MTTSREHRTVAITANRLAYFLSRYWLLLLTLLLGLWVGLPWLAPVFMKLGWTGMGNAIYLLYAPQCHQFPQRSFFLFGAKPMYSLSEIQAAWQQTNNPLLLRQFTGNPAMGWKVAWSDRMVAMYTSIPLFGLLYWPFRRRLRSLPLWAFALLLLPMAIDGGSHTVSDLAGIGNGFRDSNAWLAALTDQAFPATFYAGDALGSFNSWMRLLTGLLFGLGVVWLVYPSLYRAFNDTARQIEDKFRQADLPVSSTPLSPKEQP
jgi:uncharacterized membrane protein